jgi:phosphohistidine swiveling domain-containing protein
MRLKHELGGKKMAQLIKAWESSYLLPIHAEHNLMASSKDLVDIFGIGHTSTIIKSKGKAVETFYSEDDIKVQEMHGLKVFSDTKRARKILKHCNQLHIKGLYKFNQLFERDYSKHINKELFDAFEEAHKLTKELFGAYYISQPPCFRLVEKKMMNLLMNKLGEEDAKDALIAITTPSKLSIIQKEELDRLNAALRIKNGAEKEEVVSKHYIKYRFLGTDEGNTVKSINYFENKVSEYDCLDLEDIKEKIKKISCNIKEANDVRNKILNSIEDRRSRIALDEMSNVVREFAIMRFKLRLSWVVGEWAYRKIFSEIGKRKRIEVIELECYLMEEIKELVLNSNKVNSRIIDDRQKEYVAALSNDKISIFTGKEAKEYLKTQLKNNNNDKNRQIIGKTACKGKVRGFVRILRSNVKDLGEEMNKMNKGEILVATQTKPQYMPAIAKASAIVTNEGGICSHAAVVARELNIPTIIGTGNATDLLKEGDLVEVDADNGVVKIIMNDN